MRMCLVAACSLVVMACGTQPQLKKNIGLDLAKVTAFLIGSGATSGQALTSGTSHGGGSVLYAMDASGNLTVTEVADGNSMGIEPKGIYPTPKFIFFAYGGVFHQGQSCDLVAVRKADGAMFCVPANYGESAAGPMVEVEADASGDLVYVLHYPGLARLDLTGDAPTLTRLVKNNNDTPSTDPNHMPQQTEFASALAVSPTGEAAIRFGDSATSFFRIYRPDDSPPQPLLGYDYRGCVLPGLASAPGDFVFLGERPAAAGGTGTDRGSFRMRRGGDGTFQIQDEAVIPAGTSSFGTFIDYAQPATCREMHRTADRLFVGLDFPPSMYGTSANPPRLGEIVNPSKTLVERTIPGMPPKPMAVAQGNDLYFGGTLSGGEFTVLRHEIEANATTTLLKTSAYFGATGLDVTPAGDITFSARRTSDSVRVFASMAAGTATVVETVPSAAVPEVIQIQRIN